MNSKYTRTKIACYVGYIVQAVICNFLPILFIAFQDIYGLSYEKLARLIVFNFATQMAADLIAPKIIAKIGYKKTAVMAQSFAAAGLLILSLLPQIMSDKYLAIIVSVVVCAFGSGLIEVIISPMVEMLPTSNKSGNMAFLHSFYCWGQVFTVLATTAMVALFGYKDWRFVPLIWSVIPIFNTVLFTQVSVVEPKEGQKAATFWELFRNRKFRLYMLMMLCAGASELAMSQWASMFAEQALGVSKAVGDIAGPCAFAIFMGLGRVWYAAFSRKISFRKTLVTMSLLCFACYIVVAICKLPFVALLFCAFCGFTVSISWPGIISAGARSFPRGESVMFSVFAVCGDMGCSLGPWVLGIVADKLGLNFGFGVCSVFPLIMVFAALISMKNKDCKK